MLIELPKNNSEHIEIINTIHQFHGSTEFFFTLGKTDIEVNTIVEKIHDDKYERVMEYFLEELKIFTGGGHLKLSAFGEDFRERMLTEEPPKPKKFYFCDFGKYSRLVPELHKLQKKENSRVHEGNNYTVVSQLYYQGILAGSTWEIYDLPNLAQLFKRRKTNFATQKLASSEPSHTT